MNELEIDSCQRDRKASRLQKWLESITNKEWHYMTVNCGRSDQCFEAAIQDGTNSILLIEQHRDISDYSRGTQL